jgi:hypothetical protein
VISLQEKKKKNYWKLLGDGEGFAVDIEYNVLMNTIVAG